MYINIVKIIKQTHENFELNLESNLPLNKITAIFGQSGSGKSTLLNIIAGLEDVNEGKIIFNHELWFDSSKKYVLKTQKRHLGFVFQENSLFPNMTIKQNLLFADKSSKDWIDELITLFELEEFTQKLPKQLSGGQKQKVAFARALVQKPQLLLLDEPFSAIDNESRFFFQDTLLKIQKELQFTVLLVSHNIEEVIKLADYVLVLEKGKLILEGKPAEVYENKGLKVDWGLKNTTL